MMNNRNKRILFAKLKPYRNKEFYGYLTPVEILYLVSIGCEVSNHRSWWIDYAQEAVTKGRMFTTSFYFTPSKELMEKLPAMEKHNGT